MTSSVTTNKPIAAHGYIKQKSKKKNKSIFILKMIGENTFRQNLPYFRIEVADDNEYENLFSVSNPNKIDVYQVKDLFREPDKTYLQWKDFMKVFLELVDEYPDAPIYELETKCTTFHELHGWLK